MGGRHSSRGASPGRALLGALLLLSVSASHADLITSGVEELAGFVALQASVRCSAGVHCHFHCVCP